MPPTIASPSVSAARMCLHHARNGAGLRYLTLKVREIEIAALIRKGLLCPGSEPEIRAYSGRIHFGC